MVNASTAAVSPAKHTESARIPDVSRMGEMKRRVSANMPVVMRQKWMMIALPVALIGIGSFFFFRNSKMRSFVSRPGSRKRDMSYDSVGQSDDLINNAPIV